MAVPLTANAHHNEVVDKLGRGRTKLESISSSGKQGNGDSGSGCYSGSEFDASDDGRFVVFTSAAANLDPSDVNGRLIPDVFVHDNKTGRTELVSKMPNGAGAFPTGTPPTGFQSLCYAPVAQWSGWPVISGNGRYVAFASTLPL